MKVEDIKTISDAQRYVEGCLNDYESGLSTKEETLHYLGEYTMHLMGLFYTKFKENETRKPE